MVKQYKKIYLGRDNPFFISPLLNDVSFSVEEMNSISKVGIKYKNTFLSSVLYPGLFDYVTYASELRVYVNITGIALEIGKDEECEFVVYTAKYPSGVVSSQLLSIEVSNEVVQQDSLYDPFVTTLKLNDIVDVTTDSGFVGYVLTQLADGTFAMRMPTAGSTGSTTIDESLLENLSFSGPSSVVVVGESVVWGDMLYKNKISGKYYKAKANSILTAPATRMALSSAIADAAAMTLCPGGIARNDAWAWTNDGSIFALYLSASIAGGLTEVPDVSINCVGQVIAVPLAANIIEIMPPTAVVRY